MVKKPEILHPFFAKFQQFDRQNDAHSQQSGQNENKRKAEKTQQSSSVAERQAKDIAHKNQIRRVVSDQSMPKSPKRSVREREDSNINDRSDTNNGKALFTKALTTESFMKNKTGVLQQLWSRTTIAEKKMHKFIPSIEPGWSPCPWIRLPINKASTVTCVTFDKEGVLLAVALQDRHLLIWDWDTVISSDIQGRRDGQVDTIEPVLKIKMPCAISNMRWSNDDFLLVSFRNTPQLFLYDMARLSENPALSPKSCCTKLPLPKVFKGGSHQGPKCISFLPHYKYVVASYPGGHVCCWRVVSSTKLLWTWKNSESITCIHTSVAANLILLGGTDGGFSLLDWQRTKRKSFSNDETPTILSTWKTLPWFRQNKYCIQDHDLGVQAMILETIAVKHKIQSLDQIGICRLTWVTSGGWVLSKDLDNTKNKKINVIQNPPHIRTLTAEGTLVTINERFSSPRKPVLSASANNNILVWLQVPQTTIKLPARDKRVCQERQVISPHPLRLGYIREQQPNKVRQVSFKRQVTALVLHPTQSWMIAVHENKLCLWNNRLPPTGFKKSKSESIFKK